MIDIEKLVILIEWVVLIFCEKYFNEVYIFVWWVNSEGVVIFVWVGEYSYFIYFYIGDILREGEGGVEEVFYVIIGLYWYFLMEGDY